MDETNLFDDLVSLQRKEKKELLAQTQKMKHSVSKGDKKKKKEVTAEITQMLADLELKHEEQLKQYKEHQLISPSINAENCLNDSSNISSEKISLGLEEELQDSENVCEPEVQNGFGKLSKAQKRRNKKSEQQKAREKAIEDEEKNNLNGLRHLESLKIKEKLNARGLILYEIPSDGNCLYKAIEHQLYTLNIRKTTVASLREETAKYLLSHKEDYFPFLVNPKTGDCLSNEQFEKYCDDIVTTPAWGGHIEIKILSCIIEKPIEVIQADGPSVIVGEENSGPRLIISYHRYMFGLGEHYNSVISVEKCSNEASNVD